MLENEKTALTEIRVKDNQEKKIKQEEKVVKSPFLDRAFSSPKEILEPWEALCK